MLRGSALATHTGTKIARHISFAGAGDSDSDSDDEKLPSVTIIPDKDDDDNDDANHKEEEHVEEDGDGDDGEEEFRFGMVKVDHIYELKCVNSKKSEDETAKCSSEGGDHSWEEIKIDSLLGHLTCSDGSTLRLEACRSGLYQEHLVFHCSTCGFERHVVVEAKIMGSNKGTPSLRHGVHCVGVRPKADDDDSDSASDSGSEKEDDKP